MRNILEVGAAFLRMGLISFGGPIAHLGFFHDEFVQRRKWLSDQEYADVVAICQFLPGPSSSQAAFAIGRHRAGVPGAIAASLAFLLPSAVAMIVIAAGLASFSVATTTRLVHGLKLAAVAIVAQAVWIMGRKLCPDFPRIILCVAVAATTLLLPSAITQLLAILTGAVFGVVLYGTHEQRASNQAAQSFSTASSHDRLAIASLIAFALLLGVLPALSWMTDIRAIDVFDSFFRAGSLVFGGGHVVLPLLRTEVIPDGLLSEETFIAGYGATQAMPGPLFSFAGYLGASIFETQPWLGGAWCLFAIFLPAWLLMFGVLPFWAHLRDNPRVRAMLTGANAAVTGLLLAALISPVIAESVKNGSDAAIAGIALVLLMFFRAPAWSVVLLAAAAGYLV